MEIRPYIFDSSVYAPADQFPKFEKKKKSIVQLIYNVCITSWSQICTMH